jgi:DNA-binding IclR family transcriptional regulator
LLLTVGTDGEPVTTTRVYRRPQPALYTAIGLAMLAHLPPEELQSMFPKGMEIPRYGANIRQLRADLRRIRQQGFAVLQEGAEQELSIGVWVGNPPYAGISMTGRIEQRDISTRVRALQRAAHDIDPDTRFDARSRPSRPAT